MVIAAAVPLGVIPRCGVGKWNKDKILSITIQRDIGEDGVFINKRLRWVIHICSCQIEIPVELK